MPLIMKKYITLFSSLLLFLVFSNHSFAVEQTLYEQTSDGFTNTWRHSNNPNGSYDFHTTSTAYITRTSWEMQQEGSYTSGTYIGLYNDMGTLLSTSSVKYVSSFDYYDFSFVTSTPVQLIENTTYTFKGFILVSSSLGTNIQVSGSALGTFTVYGTQSNPSDINISFFYPTNGTTTPLFNPWILSSDNTISNHLYRVDVDWYSSNYPVVVGAKQNELRNSVFLYGSQIEASGISIPRIEWNFDFATDTVIQANASIYDTSADNLDSLAFPVLKASTSISFTLQSIPNANGEYVINSSTGNGTYTNSTTTAQAVLLTVATTSFNCQAPASIADFGGGINWALCRTTQFLFTPQTAFSQNYIISQIENGKNVFPFSIVFGLENSLVTIASTTMNDSSSPTLSFPLPMAMGSTTFEVLSSSTLRDRIGDTATDQYFEIMGNAMWILVAIAMIKTIL